MTVRTQAQKHHIKERSGWVENVCAISLLQSSFVLLGGVFGTSVHRNGVNVLWRHRRLREHRLTYHSIIAFRIIVRDEPLVAKIPGDTWPWKTIPEFIRRQKLVQRLRGRSARQ